MLPPLFFFLVPSLQSPPLLEGSLPRQHSLADFLHLSYHMFLIKSYVCARRLLKDMTRAPGLVPYKIRAEQNFKFVLGEVNLSTKN